MVGYLPRTCQYYISITEEPYQVHFHWRKPGLPFQGRFASFCSLFQCKVCLIGPGQSTVRVRWSGHGWVPFQDLSVLYIYHGRTLSSPIPLEEARAALLRWLCFILQPFPAQSQLVGPGQSTVGIFWSRHGWVPPQDLSVLYSHHGRTLSSPFPLEEAWAVLPRSLCFILQPFPVQSQLVGPGQSTVKVCWSVHGWVPSQDLSVLYIHHGRTLTSPFPLEIPS
jgi:hypothetical protein